jgi:hypothetical protein
MGCGFQVWDHPFKTSACLRGVGGSPLPMFADARGVGVLELPTSAIFESKYQETNSIAATCFFIQGVQHCVCVFHTKELYESHYRADALITHSSFELIAITSHYYVQV